MILIRKIGMPIRWGTALRVILPLVLLALTCLASTLAAERLEQLTIIVPSVPGGGFDRTAVAVREALLEEHLVDRVDLIHSPGAGGLVALAQFVEPKADSENVVMIGGQTNLGASRFNRSRISLKSTVPIARLNAITIVIAVRSDSPIQDWEDLKQAFRDDPEAVRWVGGSEGSADQQLVMRLANKLRVDRDRIAYSPIPGGGDTTADRVIDGTHVVAVSSFEELADYLARGQLRAIAISTADHHPGLAALPLREQGTDVDFTDWKGVFAPPGVSESKRKSLIELFAALTRSPAWQRKLMMYGWRNNLLVGDAFSAFVAEEDTKLGLQIAMADRGPDLREKIVSLLNRPYRFAILASLIAVALLAVIYFQRQKNQRASDSLRVSLTTAIDERARATDERDRMLADVTAHVEAEFKRWRLSEAERDIGWLILKGFSFKEIGALRNRSERTIRQQAGAIYGKSGLTSRSELSAYFLEDLFAGKAETAH